jgi:hypothetical protein
MSVGVRDREGQKEGGRSDGWTLLPFMVEETETHSLSTRDEPGRQEMDSTWSACRQRETQRAQRMLELDALSLMEGGPK